MALRIANLRLPVEEPEAALPQHLARVLGVHTGDLAHWRILRKSLDARDKDALRFVYTAEVSLSDETGRTAAILKKKGRVATIQIEPQREASFILPAPGARPLVHRPVIVGSGPAGLLAGYILAQ